MTIKKFLFPFGAMALAVVLSGCWTRNQVIQPQPANSAGARYALAPFSDATGKVPPELLASMSTYLRQVLTQSGAYDETPSDRTLHVAVEVVTYRMRNFWWRILLGWWGGRDTLASRVTVTDVRGETVAASVISSFNQTASGGGDFMGPANMRHVARYLAGKKVRR